jgi:hypothetical protein
VLRPFRSRLTRDTGAYAGAATGRSPDDLCACLERLYELINARNAPTLCWAELFTLTSGFSGKPADFGIYVTVKTADQSALIASASNAEAGSGFFYPQNSPHFVPLVIDGPGITKADCRGFRVRLQIKLLPQQPPEEPWGINVARVTLYFTDGTTLVAERLDFLLRGGDDPPFDPAFVINDQPVAEFASP